MKTENEIIEEILKIEKRIGELEIEQSECEEDLDRLEFNVDIEICHDLINKLRWVLL